MLQATVRRLDGIARVELSAPMVISSEDLRFVIDEQLLLLRKLSMIIRGPMEINTAPASAITEYTAMKKGAVPVFLVMPADHVIVDVEPC